MLARAPVKPAAAAITPAQLSVNGQVDQPLIQFMLDQGPEQQLETGSINEDTQGWRENQQQGQ